MDVEIASGVSLFTLDNVKPHLRAELSRRILGLAEETAELIGTDRAQIITSTMERYAKWLTPIAEGDIQKISLANLDTVLVAYSELSNSERKREAMIRQGIRFGAILSEIIAIDAGAIACKWIDQSLKLDCACYDNHCEQDGKVYAVRGSWVERRGFITPPPHGYFDEITPPAHDFGCLCYVTWLYSLRSLPPCMLSEQGEVALTEARKRIAEL